MKAGDLQGQRCVVTGASSGIGLHLARRLLHRGAHVVAVGRDDARADEAFAGLESLAGASPGAAFLGLRAEFSELDSVRALAAQIRDAGPRVDLLVNNAGLLVEHDAPDVEGVEFTLVVNCLAPFVLTSRLLPALAGASAPRIVNTCSSSHSSARPDLELPSATVLSGFHRYARSKLALMGWTFELAKRASVERITVNGVHPGVVGTKLAEGPGLITSLMRFARPLLMSADEAASNLEWVATAPELAGISGRYFVRRRERKPGAPGRDPGLPARAWSLCERSTGERPELPRELRADPP